MVPLFTVSIADVQGILQGSDGAPCANQGRCGHAVQSLPWLLESPGFNGTFPKFDVKSDERNACSASERPPELLRSPFAQGKKFMSEMIPRLEKEEAKWETSLQEEEQKDEAESRVKLDKSAAVERSARGRLDSVGGATAPLLQMKKQFGSVWSCTS